MVEWLTYLPRPDLYFFFGKKNVYLGCFPILKSEHAAFGIDLYELEEVSKIWLYDRLDVYRIYKRIQQNGEFYNMKANINREYK